MVAYEQTAISDRAKGIASVAVFAALIVALGAIYIPLPFTPVPVTGQTLGILLAANLLGARRAAASVALVLLLAAAGMPVLAGGRAGVGTLLGPSGGYFVGFLLTAAVLGAGTARLGSDRKGTAVRALLNSTLGIFLVYLPAVPWLAFVTGRSLSEAVAAGMLPFLPGDLFKAAVAAVVSGRVLAWYGRSLLIPLGHDG